MPIYGSGETLKTLEIAPDGEGVRVPRTRMSDAMAAQSYCRRLIDNDDSKRGFKRASVNGLRDGNAPYQRSDLLRAGRADACNVNWGTARSYMESAGGAIYDLFTEAPGYVTIFTDHGNGEQQERWNSVISREVDRSLKQTPVWDYEMSLSIDEMVWHGCGPLLFEDAWKPLPKAFLCGDLKVPEFTKSDTHYWESGMVQATYYPPELYAFIEDEQAAAAVGWDVEYTKKVIANAMGLRNQSGSPFEWEFYQQELKNNSLSYYDEPRVCKVCHLFWKEFDGGITQVIVERNQATGGADSTIKFLFRHERRYRSWQEVVHPMYFDHGNGGYHHSVTGLGVKLFGAMEYENRLLCNLCDKAFAPKVLFKPTSSEARAKFELTQYGEFGVLPRGMDNVQSPVAGLMDDGMKLHGMIGDLVSSNLSSYRQQVPARKEGNPPTAFQKQYEASMAAALSKTQFNRFYEQLDQLYAEVYRRLANPNSPNEMAQEFQRRCRKAGVPPEALGRIARIQATRVVGQGSSFLRKSAIDSLLPFAGALPEEGRQRLMEDKIAAEAGQSSVARYYPTVPRTTASAQEVEAVQWTAAFKTGVPCPVGSEQNPAVYAGTFLAAAMQAVQSVPQGGDPGEVLKFLEAAGPSIAAQLKRLGQDPTRQAVFEALSKQFEELTGIVDRLKALVSKIGAGRKAQQERTQAQMTDQQLKQAKTMSDIQIKQVKTQAQLAQSNERHRLKMAQGTQDLVMADARTAAELQRERARLEAELAALAQEEAMAGAGNGE